MAVPLDIYKERRVVPVEFHGRAKTGDPDAAIPEIDNRSYRSTEFAPIVGIMQDKTITVRLSRVMIDNAAKLVLKSSDATIVDIISPASKELPNTQDMDIQLKGVSGGANPKKAKIEVHFDSDTGPIIHTLHCWVVQPRRVAVTPHLVTIAQTGGGAAAQTSVANVNAIMNHVRAIWAPAGITIAVGATVNDNYTFATAGVVSVAGFPGEVRTLLTGASWVANTINAYFVPQIGGGFLGLGISRPSSVSMGTGNPGIILGDTDNAGNVHDTPWAGNDLAHEMGHFLQLWHPNNLQPPNEREDTWSRRQLMHNNNTQNTMNNFKDDNGYGAIAGPSARRGALITIKSIPNLTTDGQFTTARGAVLTGPY